MKVEYGKRALADLEQIAAYHLRSNNHELAAALVQRIQAVVSRIAARPYSARRVAQRQYVHVVPLIRYPYKVFYRIQTDRNAIIVLRVRHEARRPLREEG